MTAQANCKLKVFLCHSSHDKPAVREIDARLKAEGWIDPWLDEEKLFPGQDWDLEIEKAVEATDAVLVFLSDNSVSKEGYIQKEIRFILNMAEYKPEGTLFILPMRLNECPLPRRLRSWHCVDYFPDERKEWAYGRLVASLRLRAEHLGIDVEALLAEAEEKRKRAVERSEQAVAEQARREQAEKERKEKEAREAAENAERERIAKEKREAEGKARLEKEAEAEQERKAALEKPLQDRVLEAAIEKEVVVGKSTELFVYIRRCDSESIVSVVKKQIDEKASIDESSVHKRDVIVEFPIENGQLLSAGIILKLTAYDFHPQVQSKSIKIPPDGDAGPFSFNIVPLKAGELILSLELILDEISLATRTIRTKAFETEKALSAPLVVITVPIIVQQKPSVVIGGNVQGGNIIIGDNNFVDNNYDKKHSQAVIGVNEPVARKKQKDCGYKQAIGKTVAGNKMNLGHVGEAKEKNSQVALRKVRQHKRKFVVWEQLARLQGTIKTVVRKVKKFATEHGDLLFALIGVLILILGGLVIVFSG